MVIRGSDSNKRDIGGTGGVSIPGHLTDSSPGVQFDVYGSQGEANMQGSGKDYPGLGPPLSTSYSRRRR